MKDQSKTKRQDKRAKIGDTILFHYTARLDDGKIVGSTKNKEPKKLTLGKDQLHRTLEIRIVGMSEGESQIVTIPANKAYGPYRESLIFTFEKTKFKTRTPEIGDRYKLRLPSGENVKARVAEKTDTEVTLDANHVLAGKDLYYEIELVQIN